MQDMDSTTIPGLGLLSRLPWELRIEIYEHCLPRDPHNPRPDRPKRSKPRCYLPSWKLENCLPLLRTSRALYEEVQPLIYAKFDLVFQVSPYMSYEYAYSEIQVVARNPNAGRFSLPPLTDSKQKPWSRNRYGAFPLHLWRSVTVELEPVLEDQPGGLIISWRSMKLLGDVLGRQKLACLHVLLQAEDNCAIWVDKETKQIVRTFGQCAGGHVAGDIQVLLVPLGRLRTEDGCRSTVILHAQNHVIDLLKQLGPEYCSLLRDNSQIAPLLPSMDETTPLILSKPMLEMFDSSEAITWLPFPESDTQEGYIELCLDHRLNRFSGKAADALRGRRLRNWNQDYERRLTTIAGLCAAEDKERALSAVVMNWAVLRTVDPVLYEKDLCDWHNPRQITDWDHSEQLVGQQVSEICKLQLKCRESCRSANCDRKFEYLTRKGFFYHRRILVTSLGISWDPDLTKFSRYESCRPRNDVLFIHEPEASDGVEESLRRSTPLEIK